MKLTDTRLAEIEATAGEYCSCRSCVAKRDLLDDLKEAKARIATLEAQLAEARAPKSFDTTYHYD